MHFWGVCFSHLPGHDVLFAVEGWLYAQRHGGCYFEVTNFYRQQSSMVIRDKMIENLGQTIYSYNSYCHLELRDKGRATKISLKLETNILV